MKNRPISIPSTRALVAFECAARLGNFSRAAQELNTSQSAVSRHIADLEARLGVPLFERRNRRVALNAPGTQLHRAVASGLETIRATMAAIAQDPDSDQLTIACTHEISHLLLMPLYDDLDRALGRQARIRILTQEYETLESSPDPRIDLLFHYDAVEAQVPDGARIFQEAVRPVCSPHFAQTHAAALAAPLSSWSQLPFLRLVKENQGWATWDDWFESAGAAGLDPGYTDFDNYVYLLEAAAAGRGLALGWRGLVERHLATGVLVPITDGYVTLGRALFATLTVRGRSRPIAKACLEFLGGVPGMG